MVRCQQFLDALRLVVKEFRMTNMHIERLLAATKQSYSHVKGAPLIERVRAGSLLSEVLTQHLKSGGSMPGLLSRDKLVASGVALRCSTATRVRGKPKPSSGFIIFSQSQETDRKANGISMAECGGRKSRFADLSRAWGLLQPHQRDAWTAKAKADWVAEDAGQLGRRGRRGRKAEDAGQLDDGPGDISAGGNAFWDLGDATTPFTEAAFVKLIHDQFGSMVGCSTYLDHFRQRLLGNAFVADEKDIIAGTEYDHPEPCSKKHPGVCCTDDAAIFPQIIATSEVILSFTQCIGEVYKFTSSFQDAPDQSFFALCGSLLRKRNISMWAMMEARVVFTTTPSFQNPCLGGAGMDGVFLALGIYIMCLKLGFHLLVIGFRTLAP